MARIANPTPQQVAQWERRLKTSSSSIRANIEHLDPWSLYQLKDTGHRVLLEGVARNGSLVVSVRGAYNHVVFERVVFGVMPDDLEPCELPGPDEKLGAELTDDEEIDAYLAKHRRNLVIQHESGNSCPHCSCTVCGKPLTQ